MPGYTDIFYYNHKCSY